MRLRSTPGGSIIWTLAGEDVNGNKAILISNPSPNTINLTLTLNNANLTTTIYTYVNQYSVTDSDSGQTPHSWTSGVFVLPPYTSHLIEMSTTSTVGINEPADNKVAVTIFPNPFSTQSTLKVGKSLSNASISIYNLFGQQVKEIKNIYGQTATFSRNNITSGLYFVQLTQDNKVITTEKIIITD